MKAAARPATEGRAAARAGGGAPAERPAPDRPGTHRGRGGPSADAEVGAARGGRPPRVPVTAASPRDPSPPLNSPGD